MEKQASFFASTSWMLGVWWSFPLLLGWSGAGNWRLDQNYYQHLVKLLNVWVKTRYMIKQKWPQNQTVVRKLQVWSTQTKCCSYVAGLGGNCWSSTNLLSNRFVIYHREGARAGVGVGKPHLQILGDVLLHLQYGLELLLYNLSSMFLLRVFKQ